MFHVGQVIKCADCGQESPIEFTLQEPNAAGGNITTYYPGCEHCNALCQACGSLARNVSDTAREVHVFCDPCVTKEMDDAEAFSRRNEQMKLL
jgi:hypothetical protein